MTGLSLVLDDDAATRQDLQRRLNAAGWRVRSSKRTNFGIELARRQRPNLVFLDVALPSYAPEAIAASLHIHFGPRLPIVAMGAIPQPELVERIGAFGFLAKPFQPDRVDQLLARAAELAETRRGPLRRSDEAMARMEDLRKRRNC